ncbi:hypothetical protein JTB14_000905 [Gonioctena quinquepunctata]|nr:hypothetical protein JTB14_000905 [Gonioctena quinquepunctata]
MEEIMEEKKNAKEKKGNRDLEQQKEKSVKKQVSGNSDGIKILGNKHTNIVIQQKPELRKKIERKSVMLHWIYKEKRSEGGLRTGDIPTGRLPSVGPLTGGHPTVEPSTGGPSTARSSTGGSPSAGPSTRRPLTTGPPTQE